MKSFQRVIIWMVIFIFMAPLAGCGTLLYPERRQQQHLQVDPGGRRIDPAVAVMNAACLVFFIIPGVVAFVVDFSTGAIYLPGGRTSLDSENEEAMVSLPVNNEEIEEKLMGLSGIALDMKDPRMEAFVLDREGLF